MQMIAIMLLAISFDAQPAKCDYAEINTIWHEGRVSFKQIIFWDFNYRNHRFDVREWRLVNKERHLVMLPLSGDGGYLVTFLDGKKIRNVHVGWITRTNTLNDPEVDDRYFLPRDRRKKLFDP